MNQDKPSIWAHRGARGHAPENTLAAARLAADQGAHGWELDVRLTADGRVIVLHDRDLRRTTDIAAHPDLAGPSACLADRLDLEAVERLDAGSWFSRDDPFGTVAAGEVTADQAAAFAGEPVPTLTQALDLSRVAGLFVNVEIKDLEGGDDDALARRTLRIIRDTGMSGRVIVSSFRVETLGTVRSLDAGIPVALLADSRTMALPTQDILTVLRDLRAQALHPPIGALEPGRVAAFRRAGFAVNVWTVNDAEDLRRLAREGATAVITDFPARALGVLAAP